MATTANSAPGMLAVEGQNGDPFAHSPDAHRQRYSAFDNTHFSLYLNGSPVQAKRALQAHLAETTRRLQETSHLGNALVQQRKELEERLEEVEKQQDDEEMGPELRQRLAELEKEYNEVGRESARVFLPKSRVPSGETDTTGNSIYSSEAIHSPSKISVPSRRQRNQQPSRINDIALATEISTSLLSQLKDLQAVLLEKDEAIKAADLERSQLEIEVEGLSQRLRTLDESESRLKDVNWNLETQVRESEAQSKSASDKEHRLNHALSMARAEKSTLERELEELKQLHAKLNDDHVNKTKQHETELSGLRRNLAMGEMERGALQRKVEELANQNQELAKAMAYRMRSDEHDAVDDASPDDGAEDGDSKTPEHSPPPSPNKPTPRHGQLESETLKHSLQHAHRMIQQLKNNIHREKTEKIELKRMLQDARDELETNRNELKAPGSAGRRRKADRDAFKKPPRPDRLGVLRTVTQEIVLDDDEWEEQEEIPSTPSRRPKPANAIPGAFSTGFHSATETSANDGGFETANETSDVAFETAHEREETTTETDAFQTGVETLDGDSGADLTETEARPPRISIRQSRSPLIRESREDSYESTASTSGEEYEGLGIRTPSQHQQSRFRMRSRQGSSRRSRGSQDFFVGSSPIARDSPGSFAGRSNPGTPSQGKSLFAELNDLNGDDDESSAAEGTPSRSNMLSRDSSPEHFGRIIRDRSSLAHRPDMVDSGMMTEPNIPEPVAMSSIWSQDTQPQAPRPAVLHLSGLFAHDTTPQAPPRPSLRFSSQSSQVTEPKLASPPPLHLSSVAGHATAPQSPPVPSLAMSNMSVQDTTPQSPPAPVFNYSSVSAQGTVPVSPPVQSLNLSLVSAHGTTPQSIPMPIHDFSSIFAHHTSPRTPPAPLFEFSSLSSQDTLPRAMPKSPLNISSVSGHTTEPQHVIPPTLGMSTFSGSVTEPQHVATPTLGLSHHSSYGTEPVSPVVEESVPVSLHVSSIAQQTTEPQEATATRALLPTTLLTSGIYAQATEPTEISRSTPVIQRSRDMTMGATTPASDESETSNSVEQTSLQMSSLSIHSTDPRDVPGSLPSTFSTLSTQATQPFIPRPAVSQLSALSSQVTVPLAPRQAAPQLSMLSQQATEPLTPRQIVSELSTLSSQTTAPLAPKQATSQLSLLSSQTTEPFAPKQITSQMSTLAMQMTEPIVPKLPSLHMSTLSSWSTEPIELPKQAPWQLSPLFFQVSEPIQTPKLPRSEFSAMSSHATEPIEPPRSAPSSVSVFSSQATEPVEPPKPASPQVSAVTTQHTEPFEMPIKPLRKHQMSTIKILQDTRPESPLESASFATLGNSLTATNALTPDLVLSAVSSQGTESSRPVTAHRTGAGLFTNYRELVQESSENPDGSEPASIGVREGREPLTPISSNSVRKKPLAVMTDEGTQTMVSSEQMDKLLLARSQRWSTAVVATGMERPMSPPSPTRRNSHSPVRTPRRPGSSGSMRSRAASPPPLPPDHKELIAAAAKSLPPAAPSHTGLSATPSVHKKRPITPTIRTSNSATTPKTGGTTPRPRHQSQRGDARSGASSPLSRRSSLSSFTSELDHRFDMQGGPSFAPPGIASNTTDPRMIQAITQTMIGEYLWKYTRKTGRAGISENRHRRFFWIHPYTRTLYWSDSDPQTAGKTELKAKSVSIESVTEVDDSNPMPPGLHQKSLVVITPGRSIKFTATTGQRHETWFNALNYLCQRVDEGVQQDQKSVATDEIQDEFNGGYRSQSRQTVRSRNSMKSHLSRRTSSPHHHQLPALRQLTVTPTRVSSTDPLQHSVTRRVSSLLRPSSAMRGSFSSRRSRTSAQDSVAYEEPSSSHMELGRDIHNHMEHEIDNMVNVRACCDGKFFLMAHHLQMLTKIGKHDVGHLHQHRINSRSSFIGSIASRSYSRNESRAESRNEPRAPSRTESRAESRAEARNDRIKHHTEMEAANLSAGV